MERENTIKTPVKPAHRKQLPKFLENKAKHVQDLGTIFTNNAEIRRFVSNTIINYLTMTGVIPKDASYKWVDFWAYNFTVTFTVIINGVKDTTKKEYPYTRDFFANCFVAGFQSFAANSQAVLNNYLIHETNSNFEEAIDTEKIEELVELNKNIKSSE